MARSGHAASRPVTVNRALPEVRRIGVHDLHQALASGIEDFRSKPSHVVFVCLIYPLLGLMLARLAFGYDMLPLLFPLTAGFALVGPFAALPIYEMSRLREQGKDASWSDAFKVFSQRRTMRAVLPLGIALMGLFVLWLAAAHALYFSAFGKTTPQSAAQFAAMILDTPEGEWLTMAGVAAGFIFAAVVLAISVVSFPMLLDRGRGTVTAVTTSLKACAVNPVPMIMWGALVAGAVVLGSLPLLVGLAVVLPVLGHATWHLYRKIVA